MKKLLYIVGLMILVLNMNAQEEKKFVRKGNRQYDNKNYSDAEINYRKAIEKKLGSGIASYNLGNSLYRQSKFEEAGKEYSQASETNMNKNELAKAYHNLGNSYLQTQKYKESIEAYKKALRNNPSDLETKYNLSFAQKKLKENPQQEKKDQDKNQDKDKDKDKKEQDKDQDKKDQDKENQDNKDQQNQANKDNKISKDDAERILQAIQNDENNTQDKLKKEKAAAKKSNPEIDW